MTRNFLFRLLEAYIKITLIQLFTEVAGSLVTNPNFTMPDLHGSAWRYTPNITGWNCYPKCEVQTTSVICSNYGISCNPSWVQGVDLLLDPINGFSYLSQIITIETSSDYTI